MKLISLCFLGLFASVAVGQTTQPASAVHFMIDAGRDVHAISPLIYGVNRPCQGAYSHLTLSRLGGNRWTCYNWTNNASNAGNDYHYQNDAFLGGGDHPGGAVATGLADATRGGYAILLTVPINGRVSADKRGGGDVRKSAEYLETRFRPEYPFKFGAFTLHPDPNSAVVYQDEFVNWVATTYPAARVFFSLDNEPAIWSQTHAEAHAERLTYDELIDKSVAYAAAIKSVAPAALVFGPADYGWSGFTTLQNAPDSAEHGNFTAYYLKRLAQAQGVYGRRLLDVLYEHWYPEARAGGERITTADASPAVAEARMQAPRSLWDEHYVESSWIARNSTHGPIVLLPRLKGLIDANYPGTRLSISEYNYGGGNDISGAIAEADVLGIFGTADLFAACEWPLGRREPFVAAAFDMYRNFDGHGGAFGGQSIYARSDDVQDTSVYASVDGAAIVLVMINKRTSETEAEISIAGWHGWTNGDVFQLTAKSAAPAPAGTIEPGLDPADFNFTMPPMSVTALVLR
jgi:hypothetical protein